MAREHHVANVTPMHRPRVNPRHPSVTAPMFDQDNPRDAYASPVVMLTRVQAQLIATLLNTARPHLPSPKACDEAIELLAGKKR